MSWTYNQRDGILEDPSGTIVGAGYSGNGEGINNPDNESIHDHGPIPRGEWFIGRFFDDPGGKGPIVARLTAGAYTDTFGRDGFMIHGDNAAANHTASEGCVILDRSLREMLMASNDRSLVVS